VGRFDIVLRWGYLSRQQADERLNGSQPQRNSDLIVMTTMCQPPPLPGSAFEVFHGRLDDPRAACDHELVLVPTRPAVLDMVRVLGLRPSSSQPRCPVTTRRRGLPGRGRRAFVARSGRLRWFAGSGTCERFASCLQYNRSRHAPGPWPKANGTRERAVHCETDRSSAGRG